MDGLAWQGPQVRLSPGNCAVAPRAHREHVPPSGFDDWHVIQCRHVAKGITHGGRCRFGNEIARFVNRLHAC